MLNVAMPTIGRELGASTIDLSLIVALYLVAATSTLVPAGRLANRYGLKAVFLAGCTIAALGTLIGGFAGGVIQLWVCRCIQGIGTGAMITTAYAMIPRFVGRDHIGWGYGLLSLGAGIGMMVGLSVGGLLASYAGWRFVVVAPMVLFLGLIALAARTLPEAAPTTSPTAGIDPVGTGLFAGCLAGVMFFLNFGNEFGWGSGRILAFAVLALLSGGALAVRGQWSGVDFIPRTLLQNRTYCASLLMLFLFQVNLSGAMFVVPFELQGIHRLSPASCSLVLLAYPLVLSPIARWAGQRSDATDPLALIAVAFGLGGIAFWGFGAFAGERAVWPTLALLVCLGVATGLFTSPNNRLAMAGVAKQVSNDAAAWLPVCLNAGSVIGVSVYQTALSVGASGGAFQPAALLAGHAQELDRFLLGLRFVFDAGAVGYVLLLVVTLVRRRRAHP